jgi:uncharacterized protein YciW
MANKIMKCIVTENFSTVLEGDMLAGTAYAKKLVTQPHEIKEKDVDKLKKAGLSDGEILEINQVVSYFCYVNRTVLGLGVNTKGDVLGLSPGNSDEPNNWGHG